MDLQIIYKGSLKRQAVLNLISTWMEGHQEKFGLESNTEEGKSTCMPLPGKLRGHVVCHIQLTEKKYKKRQQYSGLSSSWANLLHHAKTSLPGEGSNAGKSEEGDLHQGGWTQ